MRDTDSNRRSPRSRRRRFLFALTALLGSLMVAEGIAWLGMQFIRADLWWSTQAGLAATGLDDRDFGEVLHPFTGICYDPESNPGINVGDRRVPVNRLGFTGEGDPVQKRSPDKLIIGVAGGSFAWGLVLEAEAELRRALQADPRLAEREIVIVDLALAGFKQPQQVMAFNYLLALGGEFDVLINFDGFNELALSTENYSAHVFTAYPKGWPLRVHDVPDNRFLTESYQVFAIRAERQRLARAVCNSPLRRLALRQVWWRVRDLPLEHALHEAAGRLMEHRARYGRVFAAGGPREPDRPMSEVYARCADLWSRCSRQLHDVAAAQGVRYYHALQPNQYVPDSKPLSQQEQDSAIASDSTYRRAVLEGYPLLIERGSQLAASGVRFIDLTQIYHDQPQTLYVDWCCHVNREGYEIVARRLAAEILSDWDNDAASR